MEKIESIIREYLARIKAGLNQRLKDMEWRLKAVNVWSEALKDITEGKNLEKWNKDVDAAIQEVNQLIKRSLTSKSNIAGYERLKNELYYLKWLISEKL